jgi:acyl carrier protein
VFKREGITAENSISSESLGIVCAKEIINFKNFKNRFMKISLDEFKRKFSEVLEDDLILELEPQSEFKNLESWDSFSGMSIIAMVDEEFGVIIGSEEMARIVTLQELFDLISSKIK